MAKPIKEIYPTLEKYVSKDAFSWILKDGLSKTDLNAIENQCRIQYLGSRTGAQSIDVLARDVSQEFFKNPKARELIAYYLNASTQNEVAEISRMAIPDILIKLRENQSVMMETGKVGRYLWALLIDERPEALNIIPIFILKVLETIRKFTSLLQQIRKSETPSPLQNFKKPPTLDPASSKWKEELNQAKRERLDAKFALDKSEAKNTQLEDRLQELQNLYKTTLTEAQGLKHEKNSFLKKIKELEHSVSEIKTERKDKESLESRLHQLERENKILKYELEKKDKTLEEFSKIKDEHEKLLKNKTLLQKRIDESEKLILFKTEEIDKIREEIKKEALIKKEARKVLKNPVPRVGIFVDVQNIFYASKERYERKLDFQKLLYQTLQGRKLVKAMAYVVITPEINQNNFMNTLETMGYETKTKNLKIRRDGSAKGDWDLGIAIDTISMADKLDVVVLVSGDGDFVDLVRMLKAKNIRVEVASFLHNSSADLIDSADFHFILDEKILLTS